MVLVKYICESNHKINFMLWILCIGVVSVNNIDSYSYAIILIEIATRMDPFSVCNQYHS